MNDDIVVQQIKSGDHQALSTLYEAYRSECIRWITRDFRCPEDDSKDIYQVAVLIVYENIHKGKLDRMTSSLKTYLFSVGKNLAHEWSRKNQRQQPFEADHFLSRLVDDEHENDRMEEKLDLIHECLKKIGPPCRQLLEQFYFQRQSMEDITLSLGYKNADTTKNQKYKCMGRLRKSYEEEFSKQLT